MASRVLLISLNRCVNPDPVFPLGLSTVAAALRCAGNEVQCHDVLVHSEPIEAVLSRFQPDVVGVSLRNIDDVVLQAMKVISTNSSPLRNHSKGRRAPVVLGGGGFSIFPPELLRLSHATFGIVWPWRNWFPRI